MHVARWEWIYIYIYIYMFIYVHVSMYVYLYMYLCIQICICENRSSSSYFKRMHVARYICIDLCMYMYTCTIILILTLILELFCQVCYILTKYKKILVSFWLVHIFHVENNFYDPYVVILFTLISSLSSCY
jgi:hypothetical protein